MSIKHASALIYWDLHVTSHYNWLFIFSHVTLTRSPCALWVVWRDWTTSLSSSCRSHTPYRERSQTHGLRFTSTQSAFKSIIIFILTIQYIHLNAFEIKLWSIRNIFRLLDNINKYDQILRLILKWFTKTIVFSIHWN